MTDSFEMKLVFRLGGIGFSLPVRDLVEVRENPGGVLDVSSSAPSSPVLGQLMQGGETIPIFDLRKCLALSSSHAAESQIVLILAGEGGGWGVTANGVEGIFPAMEFESRPLPFLLTRKDSLPYTHLDLWHDEPLVLFETRRFAKCWGVV